MRMLLASAFAVVLVSLATIAAESRTNTIPVPFDVAKPSAEAQKAAAQIATPRIDPSRVKFLCLAPGSPGVVVGIVAVEIDLSQDVAAEQLLQMGAAFAREKCPRPFREILVNLRPGDPTTFTDPQKGFEYVGRDPYPPSDAVFCRFELASDQPQLYSNWAKITKEKQIAEAARASEREVAREQQRQAEQRRQSEIATRSATFVKANGVAHFVTVEQLTANPFVYQGQVVAIYGAFEQMNSATQGLFSSQDKRFVVSGIPTARFTQQRSMVMLAGRVLGNIEIRLPVLGPTLVPQLSFVGSAFCQQQGCSEYAIRLK